MKNLWEVFQGSGPVVLMIFVQVAYASANVLYKVVLNGGMSVSVITAYRLMFGAATTLPLAILLERKNRPKLTWRVLFMIFLSGLCGGTLFQNLFVNAIALISATFATAFYNLVPGITFVLGIFFSFEQLNIGKAAGQVKLFGTVVGIGGSMLLTFYKGAEIHLWTTHINLSHLNHNGHEGTLNVDSRSKILGVLCAIGSCISFSLWLIIQAKIGREYPRQYTSTALMTLMAAAQCTVFALCVEKDWSQWKLGLSLRLLTAAYSGFMSSGVVYIATAWCVRMRGPMFVSVFNPLTLLIVAIASSLFLAEKIYLGSVIGGVLIVCGLYMVLWGKSKETTEEKDLVSDNVTQEVEDTEVIAVTTDHDNCVNCNDRSTNL